MEEQVTRYDTSRDMRTIRTKQGPIAYLGVKGRVAWLRAEHPDATIAETVNKALFDAGKGIEVHTDAHGNVTAGDLLNALLALPTPVRA